MTAIGGTFTLGGETFVLREPDFTDHAALVTWCKERTPCPYKKAKEKIEAIAWLKALEPALYQKKIEAYLIEADDAHKNYLKDLPMSEIVMKHGFDFFFWIICRKDRPNITQKEVLALITKTSPEEMVAAFNMMIEAYKVFLDPTRPATTPAIPVVESGTTSSANS